MAHTCTKGITTKFCDLTETQTSPKSMIPQYIFGIIVKTDDNWFKQLTKCTGLSGQHW